MKKKSIIAAMNIAPPMLKQMEDQITQWELAKDRRAIFLTCYAMMTRNMLAAIREEQFHDPIWVNNLLVYFATYYFDALAAYDTRGQTPAVWSLAFDAAAQPSTHPLQNLLLGVNAHINYDLVLVVGDLLESEWAILADSHKAERRADFCKVNDIIAETIDTVQDQVLEQNSPSMDLVDRIFGRLDEALILATIVRWRDEVWRDAIRYLHLASSQERNALKAEVENRAIQRGKLLLLDLQSL